MSNSSALQDDEVERLSYSNAEMGLESDVCRVAGVKADLVPFRQILSNFSLFDQPAKERLLWFNLAI